MRLEKSVGEIVSIEGLARREWRLQFIVAEHAGAFAADTTPLMVAAKNGEMAVLRSLLSELQKPDLNESTPFGLTALGYAANKGYAEIVRLLIGAGANPNTRGEVTTLQAAVSGGLEVTRLLLEAGADPNGANQYGETALMSAAALGEPSTVKELLQKGADPKLMDQKGDSALQFAQRNQRIAVVDLLKQTERNKFVRTLAKLHLRRLKQLEGESDEVVCKCL